VTPFTDFLTFEKLVIMKFPIIHSLWAVSALVSSASGSLENCAPKPPYLFLIGDSTVAINGGWGNGLLSYRKSPAEGENQGVSGSTTVSWKSNDRWEKLLAGIEAVKDEFEPIVTIQFGHNDQKVLELDEFRDNLEAIALEIEEAGGTPVSRMRVTS
jgi:hypothetical protein